MTCTPGPTCTRLLAWFTWLCQSGAGAVKGFKEFGFTPKTHPHWEVPIAYHTGFIELLAQWAADEAFMEWTTGDSSCECEYEVHAYKCLDRQKYPEDEAEYINDVITRWRAHGTGAELAKNTAEVQAQAVQAFVLAQLRRLLYRQLQEQESQEKLLSPMPTPWVGAVAPLVIRDRLTTRGGRVVFYVELLWSTEVRVRPVVRLFSDGKPWLGPLTMRQWKRKNGDRRDDVVAFEVDVPVQILPTSRIDARLTVAEQEIAIPFVRVG